MLDVTIQRGAESISDNTSERATRKSKLREEHITKHINQYNLQWWEDHSTRKKFTNSFCDRVKAVDNSRRHCGFLEVKQVMHSKCYTTWK